MASKEMDKPPKKKRIPVFPSWIRIVFIPLGLISLGILAFIWIRGVSSDFDKMMTAIFVSVTAIFAFFSMPFLYHSDNSRPPVLAVSNIQQPSSMRTAISNVVDNKEPESQAQSQMPIQVKQQQLLENVPFINQPLSSAPTQSREPIAHSSPKDKRNEHTTSQPETTIPNTARTITEQEKRKLVDLLFDCPTMSRKESRDVIVADLRETVKSPILRDYQNDKMDIRHIVDACKDYPGGLEALFDIVEDSERGSIPFRNLEAFWKQIQASL